MCGTLALLLHVDSGDRAQVPLLGRQMHSRTESSSQLPGVSVRLAGRRENKSELDNLFERARVTFFFSESLDLHLK